MNVRIHPHAEQRVTERGATISEVVATVLGGGRFSAKHGRTGFSRNFQFGGEWLGRTYANKQVLAYAEPEPEGWLVITVIVKYF